MKRSIIVLACAFALLLVGSAFATPAPNSAVMIPRVFDDCPLSIMTTTNTYPSLINITDDKGAVPCGGWANLHVWRFSTNGTTPVAFGNGDAFSFSADLVITGIGEAGLQVAPWWSQNADGRFNVRSTDGEIACFGGRLPFYSFTGTYGLHYVAGETIHMEIVYTPHALTSVSPATIEYKIVYQGMSYSSGALPFDEGNPTEDPPHGVWGMLNDANVGGYAQPLWAFGTGVNATFTDVEFVRPTLEAVIRPRVFDDCPFTTLNIVDAYPERVSFSDYETIDCAGWANLHGWKLSTDGVNALPFMNGDSFALSADLVINGNGEAGLQIAPWWSPDADGRFNVRSTDGEIACFGGRLPFYTFTGVYGLRYTAGETIHMEIIYLPHDLSEASPGTIEYKLVYQGMSYTSGQLNFDMGNPDEDPPYGLWGILNEARVGGYVQGLFQFGTGVDATFTNIQYTVLPLPIDVDVKVGTCENKIGVNSKGALPVAILGSADVDASTIDPTSVRLEGVSAKKWVLVDLMDATTSACGDCYGLPQDGYMDLNLKFLVQDVLAALAPMPEDGLEVHVTGTFSNGWSFEGVDCVTLTGNFKEEKPGNWDAPITFAPQSAPGAPVQILAYSLPTEMPVRLSVYSVTGRLVQHLVKDVEGAGSHSITWDASGQASGVYFYRFEAGDFAKTVKTLIVR